VEWAAFIKVTIQEPLGFPLRSKAEAHNHLLQVTDRFTGRVETALWYEG